MSKIPEMIDELDWWRLSLEKEMRQPGADIEKLGDKWHRITMVIMGMERRCRIEDIPAVLLFTLSDIIIHGPRR